MFTRKERPKYQTLLERKLELAVVDLNVIDSPEEFAKKLALVERLHAMLDHEKPARVSPETRATIAANLVGILLIIRHEDVNVIASKALGFVTRLK